MIWEVEDSAYLWYYQGKKAGMFQHIKEFMIWVLIWILSRSVGSNTFVVYEAQVPWEPTSGGVNLFSTIRTHIDPTVGFSQLLCKQPFILLSVSGCLTYCLTESVCQILSTLAIWQKLSIFWSFPSLLFFPVMSGFVSCLVVKTKKVWVFRLYRVMSNADCALCRTKQLLNTYQQY